MIVPRHDSDLGRWASLKNKSRDITQKTQGIHCELRSATVNTLRKWTVRNEADLVPLIDSEDVQPVLAMLNKGGTLGVVQKHPFAVHQHTSVRLPAGLQYN